MHLGLPSLIASDPDAATIRILISEYPPSHDFSIQIRIQLAVARFSHVLLKSVNDDIDSSLVRLLDLELDELKEECSDAWTDVTEMSFLAAKLYVYALAITRVRPGVTLRNIILRLGLSVSLRITQLASTQLHNNNDSPADTHGLTVGQRQRAHPKNYFRALAFAMVFLLRYFSLNSAAHADEQQLAANHVKAAHQVFQTCAVGPRDEFARAAAFFETLGRQDPVNADTLPVRLAADQRMGVSILFDALCMASEARGRPAEIEEEWDASLRTHERTPMHTSDTTGVIVDPMRPSKQESSYETMMPREIPVGVGVSGVSVGNIDVSNVGVSNVSGVREPWLADVTAPDDTSWNEPVWDMFGYQGGYPLGGVHPQDGPYS